MTLRRQLDVRVTANIIVRKLSARHLISETIKYREDNKMVAVEKRVLLMSSLPATICQPAAQHCTTRPCTNCRWKKRGLTKQPLSALHALYDFVGYCAIVVALLNANKYQSLMNCHSEFLFPHQINSPLHWMLTLRCVCHYRHLTRSIVKRNNIYDLNST